MSEAEYNDLIAKRSPKEEKRAKYGNVKKVVNGLEFDSTKEANRYSDLLVWQSSGQITELVRQKQFTVEVNGQYIGFYLCDFAYMKDGKLVVEDVKSKATRTPLYKWKKKLVEAIYGIDVKEI
jgi:hypothetical protein